MTILPEVETALRAAIVREQRTRANGGVVAAARARLRLRPRGLAAVLAALLIAGSAAAAVGVLRSGSQVPPNGPLTPRQFEGVALHGSQGLLTPRTADPSAGPAWGMRLLSTTRGELCIQIGRVAFDRVGALGRDGAFANDGRFHPFSANYRQAPPCVAPDSHGHGFLNVAEYGVPTSAMFGDAGCRASEKVPVVGLAHTITPRAQALNRQPPCNRADLRDIYYGLLGPGAISVTYVTAGGELVTTRTVGSDGAYLIVLPDNTPPSKDGEFVYDASVVRGTVRAVRYRDGHTCNVSERFSEALPCPPVGYVNSPTPLPTPAQVASRVTARLALAKAWCEPLVPDQSPRACPGRLPRGYTRLTRLPPAALLVVSFISRVAITTGRSYYYVTYSTAPNGTPRCGGTNFGPTHSDYAAGQRVVFTTFVVLACPGVAHGDVTLKIADGATAPFPGAGAGREVGHFTFTVP